MSVKSLTEAYNVLEVHSSASQSEVKSAYKRLALRTHPDKNKNDPSANAKFQQVTEAFQMVMNLRYEPVDSDDGEYTTEFNAEDLFGENFANIIFSFVFSESRRASAQSDSAKSACNCIGCQFKSFFTEQKKEATRQQNKPSSEDSSKNDATSSSAAPPSGSSYFKRFSRASSFVPQSDPHADWLSEDEGEAKAAGPVKGKKSSKKKRKNKKNAGAVMREEPKEPEAEDCAETNPDRDTSNRPDSPLVSSDSDVSSVSVSTAGIHTPPPAPSAPPVHQQWKASPATSRRVQVQTAKKSAGGGVDLPSISTANNAQRAKKSRAPHTPTASYKPRTPRTPSSTASTHVGSFSVPSTPVYARQQVHSPATSTLTPGATPIASAVKAAADDRASSSPRKTSKASVTKQPYTNPNLPHLEGVQLCRIFLLKHGKCRFGDKCKFSHGVAPGTVLAASESEDGVFVSPSVSPTRSTPSSETTSYSPAPSPREPVNVPTPVITLTPKVQRGAGRTQVAVNPSIDGFGRKSAPRPPPSQRSRTTRKSLPASDPQTSNGTTQQRTQQGRMQGQTPRQVRSVLPGRIKTNIYENAFGDSEESAGGLMTGEKGVCAFYNTPRGCRNGQNCRFGHK